MPERLTEFTAHVVDSHPWPIPYGDLFVVQIDGVLKAFWFHCPCSPECDGAHMLPSGGREPTWTLTAENDGTYSASPSILRRGGCGSHFYIRHNHVEWC